MPPAPRISLGNWIAGGSLLSMPPTPKREPSKPKPAPKKVAPPKPKEVEQVEPPKAPNVVSEGTDSPDDVLKKANEIVAEAEANKKKAEEEARKMADDAAAKKAAEEETAKKKAEEEAAAMKKAEDEAAAKKKAEEEEATKQAILDEKIEELKAEKKLYQLGEEKRKLLHDLVKSMTKGEQRVDASRAVPEARFCGVCGRRRHEGDCDDAPNDIARSNSSNSFPVVNVNVYGSSEDAVKVSGDKDVIITTKSTDEPSKTEGNGKVDTKYDTKPVENAKFTKEQDEQLLSLKTGNNTWTYIGKQLGINRNDCMKRHRELTGEFSSAASSKKEPALPDGHIDMGELAVISAGIEEALATKDDKSKGDKSKDDKSKGDKSKGDKSKDDKSKDDKSKEDKSKGDKSEDDKSKEDKSKGDKSKDDRSKENDSEKNKKAGSNAGSNKSNDSGNYKKPTVEDGDKKNESPKKDGSKSNNNENSSSDFDNNSSDCSNINTCNTTPCSCPPTEPPYIPISLSATIPLTGRKRFLVPDDTWSIKDLECLAELEFRYRQHKWLQLSAEFWNHTGRFIDPQIIEAKIMEAKFPEEEENAEKDGEISEVSFKVKLPKTKEPVDELELNISGEAWKLLNEGGGGTIKIDG